MKDHIEMTERLAKIIGELESQRKNVGNFLRETSSHTDLENTEDVLENR